jgi:hypothetical protein
MSVAHASECTLFTLAILMTYISDNFFQNVELGL